MQAGRERLAGLGSGDLDRRVRGGGRSPARRKVSGDRPARGPDPRRAGEEREVGPVGADDRDRRIPVPGSGNRRGDRREPAAARDAARGAAWSCHPSAPSRAVRASDRSSPLAIALPPRETATAFAVSGAREESAHPFGSARRRISPAASPPVRANPGASSGIQESGSARIETSIQSPPEFAGVNLPADGSKSNGWSDRTAATGRSPATAASNRLNRTSDPLRIRSNPASTETFPAGARAGASAPSPLPDSRILPAAWTRSNPGSASTVPAPSAAKEGRVRSGQTGARSESRIPTCHCPVKRPVAVAQEPAKAASFRPPRVKAREQDSSPDPRDVETSADSKRSSGNDPPWTDALQERAIRPKVLGESMSIATRPRALIVVTWSLESIVVPEASTSRVPSRPAARPPPLAIAWIRIGSEPVGAGTRRSPSSSAPSSERSQGDFRPPRIPAIAWAATRAGRPRRRGSRAAIA